MTPSSQTHNVTLDFSFIPGVFVNGRWRFWLLVLAIGIAMAAQSALPPNDYAISPDLPLPNPLWKTLLLLEGPFMPYRQGIGLYLLSIVLVIVAFGSQNTASLPGRLRNFKGA